MLEHYKRCLCISLDDNQRTGGEFGDSLTPASR